MTEKSNLLASALAGRYTLERELGRGGMATVYLATDLKHQRQVALKVLRPELAAVLGGERFLREITLTARLHHPHILPLLDSGSVGEGGAELRPYLFYTMPFVPGESLRDRLKREKQLPVEEALRITREVADALDYAHRQGIIHRDIKPENILLEGGHALVADFGIARAVSATESQKLTETGLAIGTPGYMSPEQATATKELDGRSDLYSLGCVLYEMLAGDPPYTGATPQAILARKLNEPLPRISVLRQAVPPALEEAIAKALARVPADRFQTVAEFLGAIQPDALAAFTPAGRPSPTRRWIAPALAGAALVVVLALVLPRVLPRQTASHQDAPREPVLVVPFEVKAADPALADAGQRLATEITDAIAQEGLGTVAATGDGTALTGAPLDLRRLARQNKAATLVTGTIYQHGDSVEVQVRLLRAGDLTPVVALPVEHGAASDPGLALEGARRRVLGGVAWYLSPGMQGREASLYRPPSSLEIFRLAEQADEIVRRSPPLDPVHGGGLDFAAGRYARAFRADTTQLGYAILSALLSSVGMQYDSALASLARRRGRFTRGEALQYDYAVARLGSPEELYRAATAGFKVDPAWWRFYLTFAAFNDHRPAETLRLWHERDSTGPFGQHRQRWIYPVSKALHVLGRHEEELALGREGSRAPPDPWLGWGATAAFSLTAQAFALAAMGRLNELDSLVAASHADGFPTVPLWLMLDAGVVLNSRGQTDEGAKLLTRAVQWAAAQRFSGPNQEVLLNGLALVYYAGGQYPEAVRTDRMVAPEYSTGFEFRGRAAARSGDATTALRIADSLMAVSRRWERGGALKQAAIIYALLGRRERAVSVLRQALNEGAWVGGDYIYPEEGTFDLQVLEDYPPFQALMRRKD